MKLRDIILCLEEFAPPSIAESYDNPGLIIGDKDAEISKVVVALELTEEVLDYALKNEAELIVTHHPIWFGKRYKLTTEDWVGRLLLRSIRHNLNIYALHTNLDKIRKGVSYKISEKFGMKNLEFISTEGNEGEFGLGMIGEIEPMSKERFLNYVCEVLRVPVLRYSDAAVERIRKVAVCGGSCSFLIGEAARKQADAFITADISYHKFFDNEGKFLLIDAGHFETEQYTVELIADYLSENFKKLLILPVQFSTNPVKYFIK